MKRKHYKITKVTSQYSVWYEISSRFLWFFWLTIDQEGTDISMKFNSDYEAIEFVRQHSDNTELRQDVMKFIN
jgi:hypothetical protein